MNQGMITRRRAVGLATALGSVGSATALAACGAAATGSDATKKTVAPANLNFATLYKEDPSWLLSKAQLSKFEEKFPNVKVQPDWIIGATTDYLKKVQTYLAAG